jgi:hypothetical protein
MPKRPHARRLLHPDSALVRELVDDYLRELTKKGLVYFPEKASKFSQPKPRARTRIDFLLRLLESAPPRGIEVSEVLASLKKAEGQPILHKALKEFLRRYAASHAMVVFKNHLRLRTDKVLEMLRKAG